MHYRVITQVLVAWDLESLINFLTEILVDPPSRGLRLSLSLKLRHRSEFRVGQTKTIWFAAWALTDALPLG